MSARPGNGTGAWLQMAQLASPISLHRPPHNPHMMKEAEASISWGSADCTLKESPSYSGTSWGCREEMAGQAAVRQHPECNATSLAPTAGPLPSPTCAAAMEGRLAHRVPTQGKGASGLAAAVVEKGKVSEA